MAQTQQVPLPELLHRIIMDYGVPVLFFTDNGPGLAHREFAAEMEEARQIARLQELDARRDLARREYLASVNTRSGEVGHDV
jgi:hypothetical protein